MTIKTNPTTKFDKKQKEVFEKLVDYIDKYEQQRSKCQTAEDERDFDKAVTAMKNQMRLAEYAIVNSKTHEIMLARFGTLLRTDEYCDSIILQQAMFAIREVYGVW